jgi:hypothetical protein
VGIAIAQAALQSLVDQHVGVSYREALQEIRDYVKETSDSRIDMEKIYKEWEVAHSGDKLECAHVRSFVRYVMAKTGQYVIF